MCCTKVVSHIPAIMNLLGGRMGRVESLLCLAAAMNMHNLMLLVPNKHTLKYFRHFWKKFPSNNAQNVVFSNYMVIIVLHSETCTTAGHYRVSESRWLNHYCTFRDNGTKGVHTENYISALSSSISLPRPCAMTEIGSLHLGSQIPA